MSFRDDAIENNGDGRLLLKCSNGENEEPRQCRICLDDEDEGESGTLIAPCGCKGHQKWVHRGCLDEWRANNTDHIAFSKCTECLTDYRMAYAGASAGKKEYYCYVTRDVGVGCTLLQSLMLLLGAFLWMICSKEESGNKTMAGITIESTWLQIMLADLVTGLLVVLVILGVYGSTMLCMTQCSLDQTMENIEELADYLQGSQPRSSTTDSQRAVNHPTHTITDFDEEANETEEALGGIDLANPIQGGNRRMTPRTPNHRPMDRNVSRSNHYSSHTQVCFCPDGDCCDCNCDCGNAACCCPCPSGGDCDGDNPFLLVIMMAVGAILAAIGLVVGVVLSCILLRGIMARHLFRLKKRRLTQNYVVQDLASGQAPEGPIELPPPIVAPVDGETDIPSKGKPPGERGCCQETPHKDYLRELGLMDS